MKKVTNVLLLTFLLLSVSEARRGCCSHHGGVCGCMCCDGSPLSYKCAPYYPSCNDKPIKPKKNLEKISQDSLKAIQTSLKNMGHYAGKIDGLYGKGTDTALRSFQKTNNLIVSGDIDYKTEMKLNEIRSEELYEQK